MSDGQSKKKEDYWVPKPHEVPEDWNQPNFPAAFEQIPIGDKKLPQKQYLSKGSLPVIDQGQALVGGYTDDISLKFEPGKGVIIFGDHTRAVKLVKFPFAAGADGIKILRPRHCGAEYAFYALQSIQLPNRGYSRHFSYLKKTKFPIAPEADQERIVSKIDELFSQIDEGERALARVQKLVERYRQSVLKAAVTGELTRDWREKHAGANGSAGETGETGEQLLQRILKARREAWGKAELEKMAAKDKTPKNDDWKKKYKQPPQPSFDELPTLPPRWTWVSLEQICFVETGATPKRGTSEFYENGTVPWVTSTAVNHTIIDKADEFITQAALDKTNTKIFPSGSLVVAMYGEGKTRGKVSELGIDAATNQACAALLCNHVKPAVKQYIRLFLEKNYEAIRVSSAGGVQPNLNLSKLRDLLLPLPALDEIMQIIESVAVRHADIVSLSDTLPASRNHSKALRQSILKAAFSGNLSPAIQPISNAPLKNQYE